MLPPQDSFNMVPVQYIQKEHDALQCYLPVEEEGIPLETFLGIETAY